MEASTMELIANRMKAAKLQKQTRKEPVQVKPYRIKGLLLGISR